MFVKYGFDRQSPLAQQLLLPWGGAVARVAEDATPMTKRDGAVDHAPVRGVGGRRPTTPRTSSGRGRSGATSPSYASGGVYLNFIGDEGEDRVRAAYGDEKYAPARRASRASGTPTNVFRGNQNIKPA